MKGGIEPMADFIVAKTVGEIALLLEFTDFLNIDTSEYRPYAGLRKV